MRLRALATKWDEETCSCNNINPNYSRSLNSALIIVVFKLITVFFCYMIHIPHCHVQWSSIDESLIRLVTSTKISVVCFRTNPVPIMCFLLSRSNQLIEHIKNEKINIIHYCNVYYIQFIKSHMQIKYARECNNTWFTKTILQI